MRSVPPGRAGRLWLLGKLAGARRSSDLLEQKRQLLLREYARVSALADASRVEWQNACREAERWAWRLALLGGQRELDVLAIGYAGRAELEVVWKSSMGLDHPEDGRCVLPAPQPVLDISGNAAGAPAVEAYRQALEAAVAHAVAAETKRRVANELASTRRRLRSITHRRIPELEGRLNDLELRLDAAELEDHVVGRWARERLRPSARHGPT
jgi:V/A-type H+/Na+-transporting ATPase subunit D